MNRTTVMAIGLAISIFLNLTLFVMSKIERAKSEKLQEAASKNEALVMQCRKESKAELDTSEGLRAQAEDALEDCERKVLSLSNKK